MNCQAVLQRIKTLLARLQEEITITNSYGDFSINIHAENVVLRMLNIAYGWNLQNVNYIKRKNYPAIDLYDDEKKVAVQVISIGTMEKVIHTLRMLGKNGIDKKYEHLVFYFLKDMDKRVSLNNSRITREISELATQDIHFLDNNKFYKDLSDMSDLGRLIQIQDLLEKLYLETLDSDERVIAFPTPATTSFDHPFRFFGRNKEIERVQSSIGNEKIIANCILFFVTANEHAIIIAIHSPPHIVSNRYIDYLAGMKTYCCRTIPSLRSCQTRL